MSNCTNFPIYFVLLYLQFHNFHMKVGAFERLTQNLSVSVCVSQNKCIYCIRYLYHYLDDFLMCDSAHFRAA